MRKLAPQIALATITATLLGTLVGCGEDPPPPPPPKHDFTVEVEVTDTDENPLPRVPVTLDGRVVGHTDKDGKFSGKLTELAGTDVTLGVKDIEGYRFVNEETSVMEKLKTTTVNGEKSGVPLFLQIQAESITKEYLVWVEAKCGDGLEGECEDLPVLLDGEEVARTNPLGFAHFSFSDVPQNDLKLTIDTPDPEGDDETKLSPADPEYALTLDLDSHIYLIEESFENPDAKKTKKRRRRPRRRRASKRRRPAKKKAAKKKSSKKAPKKKSGKPDNGVIDLW